MTSALDVQRALLARGYDIGKAGADGDIGPATLGAMMLALERIPLKEPDKSAMTTAVPPFVPASVGGPDVAAPPPNASSLRLLNPTRAVTEIIWHCAATPEGKDFTVADIRAWHKQRGWSDIGYHYVVYRDGTIHEGRPVTLKGAHTEGHNTGTIGCCYIGGVSADGKTAKDTRTPAQRASMLWLTNQLIRKNPTIKKVSGHNQYAAKACPSFDVRKDALGKLV